MPMSSLPTLSSLCQTNDVSASDLPAKTVAIIQARMGSYRLPGKVLQHIAGQPMLWHIVQRARQAMRVDQVVVATSTARADDPIEEYCLAHEFICFRGSETDVLDRYYQTAIFTNAEVVVRLTADCPLHDPRVIDQVVSAFAQGKFDYVSNVAPPTYPDGLDTEVFTFATLKETWLHASLASEREHVTPYIREHSAENLENLKQENPVGAEGSDNHLVVNKFRTHNVIHTSNLSSLRWTVDELTDLAFVRAIFHAIGRSDFGMEDVLSLLNYAPHLTSINEAITRNEGYKRSLQADRIAA